MCGLFPDTVKNNNQLSSKRERKIFCRWYDPSNFQETLMTTDKIGRHTRDFDIDVKPCKDYVFQVKYNYLKIISFKIRIFRL